MNLTNNIADILLWKFAGIDAPRAVGEDYELLNWLSMETPKPALDQILEWDVQYTAYKQANLYKAMRKAAYPPWREQLDMMWHDFEGWRTHISGIKAQYPKPEID